MTVTWIHAPHAQPAVVDLDLTDDHGHRLDPGNIGIDLGNHLDVVLEGTPDELRAYAQRLLEVIPAEAPQTEADVIAQLDRIPAIRQAAREHGFDF